jgi:hypothetical protein
MNLDRRPLQDVQITGPTGQDLYHAANQPHYPVAKKTDFFLTAPQKYDETYSLPLRNLLADVDVLAEVKGRITVVLPTRVDLLRFDTLVPGTVREAGGIVLTFRQASEKPTAPTAPTGAGAPRLGLEFDCQGVDGRGLWWVAYDRAGSITGWSAEARPRSGPLRLEVPPETAAVAFKVYMTEEVAYEFRLRDVPFGRSPRQFEPARFPGHAAPVSVEVQNIYRPSGKPVPAPAAGAGPVVGLIRLLVRNHSQKDVEKVIMKFTYLDATGRPLKEAVHIRATVSPGQSHLELVVKGQSQAQVQLPDKELPEETRSISVELLGVGFADGTAWPP